MRDFDASSNGRFVQSKDKASGLPLWVVEVIDADQNARTRTVKVAAQVQPVLPNGPAGMPFVPVEFTGLTVTPYVTQAGKLGYSLKASGIRSPTPGTRPSGRPRCQAGRGGPGVRPVRHPRRTIGALPVDPVVNLAALPVGRCEDGSPWQLRLLGSHLPIAGATGSGKGSVIWSAVRAMLPAILGGWVQVWALDPKRMELSFGRGLFTRYADTAAEMVGLLEDASRRCTTGRPSSPGRLALSRRRPGSRSWSSSSTNSRSSPPTSPTATSAREPRRR